MRYELSDYEWDVINPMLPNKPRGTPRLDDRRLLNGIFWALRSGAPWRDIAKAGQKPKHAHAHYGLMSRLSGMTAVGAKRTSDLGAATQFCSTQCNTASV
jgi:transposase